MFELNSVPKSSQLYQKRIKPTQRQMGDISPKIREEVKERSQGICEVKRRCIGVMATDMAHITGRKQIKRKTTAEDILHACKECHIWLDETPEGIRYRRKLREG
jgi:heterodisulfide reductase subunit B